MNQRSRKQPGRAFAGNSDANGQPRSQAMPEEVLLVSDDPEFARAVIARWQNETLVPAFTVVGSKLPGGALSADYALAIVGPCSLRQSLVLRALENSGAAIVCLSSDETASGHSHPQVILVGQREDWLDVLVQLAVEVLRRLQCEFRVQRAEQTLSESERHATLGRYILEMRHGLNNCLTSVLGNAELLLAEPGNLTAQSREQVATIHSMAMRIHEVMQRFSSLESEMQFAEKQSQSETRAVSRHAAGAH
jgi:signal transduction histidine kinase